MFFHVSRQCILVFFRYPGNWFGGRVVGWHVWKKRATIVHPFPRERMRLMHEVVEARGFFVCFSLASVCYQDLLRIVMNENVIRICHLGNLYRNSSLFGGVGDPHERKLVVEKDGERKVAPERKRIYGKVMCHCRKPIQQWFTRVYLIQCIHVPHRQMLKFARYYCSNIWDSALSIIYANIREFTNSIVHASGGGKIKFSNHIYVFTVEKCCFIFVCATRATRVRRDIVLCIYITHINCNNECISKYLSKKICWKFSTLSLVFIFSFIYNSCIIQIPNLPHLPQIHSVSYSVILKWLTLYIYQKVHLRNDV